jgi:putative peptidoglycan lipid II flippase
MSMAGIKRLAKSTAIISFGIMTSRILGFVRDILIARFFGMGVFAQAFVMAFTIPNGLRELVAEGAVNPAVVPVLTEYRAQRDKTEFFRFANVLFNIFLITLLLITIIGILASPLLIRIMAPGFIADPDKFYLTVELTKIFFPYVLLVGLTAYCMGVLNTFKHFAAPAFAGTIWNASVIGGILIFHNSFDVTHLALAILVGGVLQLLLQVFPLLKIGPFFNIKAGIFHEGSKKVGRLFLPRMIGAGIYEMNIMVDRILASLQLIVGQGAVAALYYANRLFQLPLALFGIAMATAVLPTMSSLFVKKSMDKFKKLISSSIRNMFFLSMPASIGLMVLSRPIIKVIFERGEFTSYATTMTSSVLFFYTIGLVAYGGIKILVSAFYAMQDTITPVKVASIALLTNIVLNLILMIPLKAAGLALATSISGFVNLSFLFTILEKKIGKLERKEILAPLLKITFASFVMGIVAYVLKMAIIWNRGAQGIINLILVILLSLVVYLGASVILKVKEVATVFPWIKKD